MSKNFKQYRRPYDHSAEAQARRGILSGIARNARNQLRDHKIWEDFSDGYTIPQITKRLNITNSQVWYRVHKVFRLKPSTLTMTEVGIKGRRIHEKRAAARARRIVADRKAGMAVARIATREGVLPSRVYTILRENGIGGRLWRFPRKVQRFPR